ncbi:MAG TPA: TIGR03557 family F420-dependent LLM class oxidoreductase [Candidatus Limnocylindrales bacterium]|nr:TIGR03557 family F420-dependent LLM class oxidoreductase [Candidatus Limnocylindrales bacterium]
MTEFGYKLCSEEQAPSELVRLAARAEEAGFTFGVISDHFHPWVDAQGESGFVWATLGGIAQATERLRVGTGVTCPTIRIHPAIIAHAAATVAEMMPGRFFLGVGSGENLNEHILADRWPPVDMRLDMLEEAIDVIRLLWQGGLQTHYGEHYVVENARLYTLPDELPPIIVAASGEKAGQLAGRSGDGLMSTSPNEEVIKAFREAGGEGPRYAEMTVCWADDEAEARRTAHSRWPNAGLKGQLSQELALPSHFEQAAQTVTEEEIGEAVVCGPDPERHLEKVREYIDAGFDHVFIHQVGDDQEGMIRFYEREVLPALKSERAGSTA